MAFENGDIIELQIIGLTTSGEYRNVWHYRIDNGAAPTISAANLAEAWWNHIKTAYRAAIAVAYGDFFQRVRCESMMSPTGDAGDFAIPAAEQPGSRTNPAGEQGPRFLSAAVRLNVETRLTRPGQKRIGLLYEADFTGDGLSTTYQALALAIPNAMLPQITLGAPALGMNIVPVVARVPLTLPVVTYQDWTSAEVSARVATQNTRKLGRGA